MPKKEEKNDEFGGVESREDCYRVGGDCDSCDNPDCPSSIFSRNIIPSEE